MLATKKITRTRPNIGKTTSQASLPIIYSDQDDIVVQQKFGAIVRGMSGSSDPSATVEPDHDRESLKHRCFLVGWHLRCVDIQIKAIFDTHDVLLTGIYVPLRTNRGVILSRSHSVPGGRRLRWLLRKRYT